MSVKISSFAKKKDNSNGNNSATTAGSGIIPSFIKTTVENVKIWGQPHDHTGDVNGDMDVVGNIKATGDIDANKITTNEGKIDKLESEEIKTNLIDALDADLDNAFIDTLSAGSIQSDSIKSTLGEFEQATIKSLLSEDIITKNLTVTGKAHFYELVIDKISASGGAVIFSPADGFKIDKVSWKITSTLTNNTIPVNYHLATNSSGKYVQTTFTCHNKSYSALLVESYKTKKQKYWFYSTGELLDANDIYKFKYPNEFDKYSFAMEYHLGGQSYTIPNNVVNTTGYWGVIEPTNERLYDVEIPPYPLCHVVDYVKTAFHLMKNDINGNPEIVDTKYAIELYLGDELETGQVGYVWYFYETGELYNNFKTYHDSFEDFRNYETIYSPPYNNWHKLFPILLKDGITSSYWFPVGLYYSDYPMTKQDTYLNTSGFVLTPSLLFLAEDKDGKAIRNEWQTNDQAICRSFNQAQQGVNQNVSNKYYWCLVTGTDYINGNNGLECERITKNGNTLIREFLSDEEQVAYHSIILSSSDFDGVVDPEPGDAIAMLGNRWDVDRQKAIYISAYSSLDESLVAPLFCQYQGINDYNLSSHKYSWLAANGNKLQGDLCIESGQNIEDYIGEHLGEQKNYFEEWINNVEGDLSNSYLKVLPTNTIYKSYKEWKETIGKNQIFKSNVEWDESAKRYKFLTDDKSIVYFPDLVIGDKVAIEVGITHQFQNSTEPNKATALGTVVSIPNLSSDKYTTTIKIDYIVDTDLSGVWSGMSQLKVDQDGIKMSVVNLDQTLTDKINQGIASFEIRAGQIQSQVDNLKGDVSKITQQADNIQLQVNELSIKLDGQRNKIVLDGDTEVNGAVQVNKDGVGFSLLGSNGERFDILSKSIGSYNDFTSKTEDWYLGTSGYGTSASTTVIYEPNLGDDYSTNTETKTIINEIPLGVLNSGKQIKISNVQMNKYIDRVISPADNACYGIASLLDATISIYNGGGGLVAQSSTMTGSNSGVVLTYTATSKNSYKIRCSIRISITARINKVQEAGYGEMMPIQPQGCTVTAKLYDNVTFRYYVSTDAYGMIAYDGIGINFGGGKTLYMGNEGCVIKYGEEYGLKITENAIFRLVPKYSRGGGYSDNRQVPVNYGNYNQWQRLSSSNVRIVKKGSEGVYTSNSKTMIYTFEDDEVILVETDGMTNPNFHFIVPDPKKTDIGRKIYLKTVRNESICVCSHDYDSSKDIGKTNTILYCYNHINDLCSRCDLMKSEDRSTSILLINMGNYWCIWNGGAIWNDDSHQIGSINHKA